MSPSRALAAFLLVLILAPGARASEDGLQVTTSAPIDLVGDTTVTMRRGAFETWTGPTTLTFALENVTGELRVQTWTSVRVHTPTTLPRGVTLEPSAGEPEQTWIDLRDARLVYRIDREPVSWRASFAEGEVLLRQSVDETGRPFHLAEDVEQSDATLPTPGPSDVRWRWEKGWTFLGDMDVRGARLRGYPTVAPGPLALTGPMQLRLQGGTLTVHQDGREPATFQLSAPPPGDESLAGTRQRGRAILDATFSGTMIPAFENFAVASETTEVRVDGRVTWRHATGVVAGRAVRDATVTAHGTTVLRSSTAPTGVLGSADVYEGAGEWSALHVDGALVRDAPALAEEATLVGAGGALVLLYLALRRWLGSAALYTRIPRDALLDAPIRRRIRDEVERAPGIHMRELFRRIGGGWGGFRQHLRALEAGGYLKIVEAGNRRSVYLQTEAPGPDPLHPTARRILEEIPTTGERLDVTALAKRVRLSRQLVRHHLKRLIALGLVGERA